MLILGNSLQAAEGTLLPVNTDYRLVLYTTGGKKKKKVFLISNFFWQEFFVCLV